MRVPTAERQVSKNLGNIPKLPSISTGGPTAYGVGVAQAGEELASTVSSSVQKIAKQREANKKREDAALNARLLNDFKNRNQDQLYSQEEITKNIGGVDYKMLKGAKLREEWQANGITKDYDDFYANNQNEFLEKSNDPESLYLQMEAIKQATLPRIGMHEVAQAKADQDNSYKTIVGRAINDAYEGGTVKELNVLFDEAEKYQKELDPDGIEGVFNKIADKAIEGSLVRINTGIEADMLLEGMKDKINSVKYSELKEHIKDEVKVMADRKDQETELLQQVNAIEAGNDLIENVDALSVGNINTMVMNHDLSEENGKTLKKFISTNVYARKTNNALYNEVNEMITDDSIEEEDIVMFIIKNAKKLKKEEALELRNSISEKRKGVSSQIERTEASSLRDYINKINDGSIDVEKAVTRFHRAILTQGIKDEDIKETSNGYKAAFTMQIDPTSSIGKDDVKNIKNIQKVKEGTIAVNNKTGERMRMDKNGRWVAL